MSGALPGAVRLPVRGEAGDAPPRLLRRFFLAGILVTLTAGAGWGVLLLWRIAAAGSLTAPSVFAINAHGQAQIYGWVGLFVMGFAYQAFPRFWGTRLAAPRLAALSLPLMLAGIALRSLGEPNHDTPLWAATALVGAALEAGATAAFAIVVVRTRRGGVRPIAISDRYVLAAVVWFLVSVVADGYHLAATLGAPDREQVLRQVAGFQFALRDLQLHGFAMMMIFGVSLRVFPALLGTRPVSERVAARSWWVLQAAVAGEVVGFVAFMREHAAPWLGLFALATLALAAGALRLIVAENVFAPTGRDERSLKFVRAAHLWLAVSLAMLVLAPAWMRLVDVPFSHAWYGAMRHAITVGFISLTIMGVAARVVSSHFGAAERPRSSLAVPFLLVNVGCALRVVAQVATDLTPTGFPLAGVSGLLEITGLAIWGAVLASTMLAHRPLPAPAGSGEARGAVRVDAGATIAATIRRYPATLPVFARHGLDDCCGGSETIAVAAEHNGVPLAALLAELESHAG